MLIMQKKTATDNAVAIIVDNFKRTNHWHMEETVKNIDANNY